MRYENLENRSVKKFSKATITAFIICTIFYGAFSSIAYLNFGNASLGDILLNLPENLASHVARFGQLICVTLRHSRAGGSVQNQRPSGVCGKIF